MLNTLNSLCSNDFSNKLLPYLKSILKYSYNNNWYISSDYCLDNPTRQDVLSFILIPHNDIEKTLELIKSYVPSDIKKSRKLNARTEYFFKNFPHASINFILENRNYYLPECKDKNSIKKLLDDMIIELKNKKYPKVVIEEFSYYIKNIHIISSKVFKDIILIAHIFGYISAFLRYYLDINKLLWAPDQDKTTTNAKGLLYLFSRININGYQDALGKKENKLFDIALPEKKWANELIRIADFYAGTLSTIKTKNNIKITHLDFLYKCIINKKGCLIYKIDFKNINKSGIVKLTKKVNENEYNKITMENRKH